MRILSLLSLFGLLSILAGCKTVDIENGQVPADYVHLAKKLEGVYEGSFNGVPGQLIMTMVGDQPILEFKSPRGADLLDPRCQSQIGLLKRVHIKGQQSNPIVDSAEFQFSAGNCKSSVVGNELSLNFRSSYNRVEVSLLKEQKQERRCQWDSGNPPHVPPREVCNWEVVPVYLNGNFKR